MTILALIGWLLLPVVGVWAWAGGVKAAVRVMAKMPLPEPAPQPVPEAAPQPRPDLSLLVERTGMAIQVRSSMQVDAALAAQTLRDAADAIRLPDNLVRH